jgi:hypothetical protein
MNYDSNLMRFFILFDRSHPAGGGCRGCAVWFKEYA